jgi:hypothetical protein
MKHLFILLLISVSIFGCSTNNNGTVTIVPLAPTNLTGSVISTTQINLNWTDNATNEDGYKIERKTGSGNYAVVGSTASNMTTFNDLGLTPNTSYTYRLYAFNSAGNSTQYSNEVTISTQDSIPSWLTNGLVGYWPFNGNANDESGNGNDGTVNGATLASDRNGGVNKAFSFNGTANFIEVPTLNNLQYNPITYSVWINPSSLVTVNNPLGNGVAIMGRDLCGQGIQGQLMVWNQVNAGINQNIFFYTGNNGNNLNFSPGLQSWTHLVFIWDQTDTMKLYANGNMINSQFCSSASFAPNGIIPFRIGAGSCNSSGRFFWNGKIDDIRIYNRALSASEVAYLASH